MPGPPGLDVGIAFRYVHSSSRDRATETNSSNLHAVAWHDADTTNTLASEADAEYDFGNYLVDLEVGQTLDVGDAVNLRIFTGVRWGVLEQSLGVIYCGDDFDTCVPSNTTDEVDDGRVKTGSKYWGAGPRIGTTASWNVGGEGISVFSTAAASLLVGTLETRHTQLDQSSTNASFSWEHEQASTVVPILEASLGVGYERPFGHGSQVSIQAGYQVESWINAVGDEIVDENADDVSLVTGDAALHGFFLRVRLDFGPN